MACLHVELLFIQILPFTHQMLTRLSKDDWHPGVYVISHIKNYDYQYEEKGFVNSHVITIMQFIHAAEIWKKNSMNH